MKKFFIANWKMNGSKVCIDSFFDHFNKIYRPVPNHHLVFCPPLPYGHATAQRQPATAYLGAQDCHWASHGSHTGDVSPAMLKDVGYNFVILGHSERRIHHGETHALIQKKITAAQLCGLVPILCVGESAPQREQGEALSCIEDQLVSCLPRLCSGTPAPSADLPLMVAYEPLWAIGTGVVPDLSDIEKTLSHVGMVLEDMGYDNVPLIYGGSVTSLNAGSILSLPHVEGLLIGGSSLDPESLWCILQSSSQ